MGPLSHRLVIKPTLSFLRSMHGALAALRAYDAYSTQTALHTGAKEPALSRQVRDWIRQRAALALMVATIGRMAEAAVAGR